MKIKGNAKGIEINTAEDPHFCTDETCNHISFSYEYQRYRCDLYGKLLREKETNGHYFYKRCKRCLDDFGLWG